MSRLGYFIGAAALLLLTAADASAAVVKVSMKDVGFVPAEVSARVGDTIEWQNEDAFDHTATANDKSFDLPVAAGATVRTVVGKVGTIDYTCTLHPNMTGRIIVK